MKRVLCVFVIALGAVACGVGAEVPRLTSEERLEVPGVARIVKKVYADRLQTFEIHIEDSFQKREAWTESEVYLHVRRKDGEWQVITVQYTVPGGEVRTLDVEYMGPTHPTRQLWTGRLRKVVEAGKEGLS